MTKQSSQNSIIFLAALGVYLGLIVSGASPGVISQQAALTRSFDISEEIETTDDLDKDPEVTESVESPGSEDRSVLFTFDSFFSSLYTAAANSIQLPDTVEFALNAPNHTSTRHTAAESLTAKITVLKLARAGI
ncbi:MAG: hypothetical protein IPM50_13420 [Acidobacteriota bacterium]|nr:MAG: hypothetical protein IPM50_13420 [Acidobacteriota bacterium]